MKLLLACAFVLASSFVSACINDRDTLEEEAQQVPGIVWIITGRFERYPAQYYQMRIDRVEKELARDPSKLDLYDDIAAAYDRLHKDDHAIEWMQRKRQRLSGTRPTDSRFREAWYRTFANEGTFIAHRALTLEGENCAKELARGRDLIGRALQIKPDAHFGREAYQYAVLEWLVESGDMPEFGGLIETLQQVKGPKGENQTPTQIAEGLAGLVRLGGAWRSPDIFAAISYFLQRARQSQLASLAESRAAELVKEGSKLIDPNLPGTKAAAGELYAKLRSDADAWHAHREAFMLQRLKTGMHPDTHPTFWDGYKERPLPQLPGASLADKISRFASTPSNWLSLFVVLAVGAIVAKVTLDIRTARRKRHLSI